MKKSKVLSNTEIATFCNQLSLLINAGITPAESIGILLKDTTNQNGIILLTDILNACNEGSTFHDALTKTNVFPSYFLHMISLGEESGNLDTVIQNLSIYYEREENISQNIQNALRYPIIMILMMLIVIIVLLTKVLPIFQQVFIQLGTNLSSIAQRMMIIGHILNQASAIILFLMVIAFLIFFILKRSSQGKVIIKNLLTYSPFTKNFSLNIAYGRFASGLSIALSSGLDTYHSLDLINELVENQIMQQKIKICKELLNDGHSFPESLQQSNIFSNLHTQMVSVGFRTGNMDTVMKKIAEDYEKETDQKLQSILTTLEPTLVIIFSFIVGLILLSVILPLIGIMSSIS